MGVVQLAKAGVKKNGERFDVFRWGKGRCVHFNKHVDVWFGKEVTIAKLEFDQHQTAQRLDWSWQRYNDGLMGTYVDQGS